MREPRFISFGTREYEVVVGTAQARGTFYIRRVRDDTTTYRFVCSEGFEEYRLLKRAWRASQWAFHWRCRTYNYHPE